jgi:protein DGCR14
MSNKSVTTGIEKAKKATAHLLDTTTIEEIAILGKRKQEEIAAEKRLKKSAKPQRSISGKVILPEEEYSDKLHDIIQRDFFPDLERLRDEVAYKEAAEEGDFDKMTDLAVKRMKQQQEPNKDKSGTESLDHFLVKYTGEDHASFERIAKAEKEQKLQRHKWLYNKESGKLLLQKSSEKKLLTGATSKSSNDGLIEFWPHKPLNALMFHPNSAPQAKRSTDIVKQTSKGIVYSNTRVPEQVKQVMDGQSSASQKNSLMASITDPNLRGTVSRLQAATPAVISKNESAETSNAGYGLVATTPSPAPERGGATPMLTWGIIESTPLLLEGRTEDVQPLEVAQEKEFKLPELRKREEIGMKLSNEATKKLSEKTKPQPSPLIRNLQSRSGILSSSSKMKSMTPAAQSLLAKLDSKSSQFGSKIVTPSPSIFSKSSKTPVIRKKE